MFTVQGGVHRARLFVQISASSFVTRIVNMLELHKLQLTTLSSQHRVLNDWTHIGRKYNPDINLIGWLVGWLVGLHCIQQTLKQLNILCSFIAS